MRYLGLQYCTVLWSHYQQARGFSAASRDIFGIKDMIVDISQKKFETFFFVNNVMCKNFIKLSKEQNSLFGIGNEWT